MHHQQKATSSGAYQTRVRQSNPIPIGGSSVDPTSTNASCEDFVSQHQRRGSSDSLSNSYGRLMSGGGIVSGAGGAVLPPHNSPATSVSFQHSSVRIL